MNKLVGSIKKFFTRAMDSDIVAIKQMYERLGRLNESIVTVDTYKTRYFTIKYNNGTVITVFPYGVDYRNPDRLSIFCAGYGAADFFKMVEEDYRQMMLNSINSNTGMRK